MKKIIIFPILVLFFTNCQKILRPEETSISKITNYDQLVAATNGLYGTLASAISDYFDFYAANLKADDLNIGNPTYDSYYLGASANCYTTQNYYIYSSSSYVWQSLFSSITSANNLLKQYNLAILKDKPTRQILGEIYLIRAYCYFRLTRVYGQIPIIKDININYTVSKASYIEIYNFIESDLNMAMELLPENNASARVPFVTAHRGTAKAILAELYLNWAGYPLKDITKYGLAAKESGEIIDSANYFGFGLLNDFANVWDTLHLLNSESVFSVYFPKLSLFTPDAFDKNKIPYYGIYIGLLQINLASSGMDILFYPTEVNFYNNYPSSYRKEITFFETIYVPPYWGNAPKTGYIDIDKVGICNRIGYRKFYYQCSSAINEAPPNNFFYGIPRVYIFRYAQTLLTYAEAMARSSQPDAKAYDCVNQIRRRAHHLNLNSHCDFDLPVGLSSTAFADSVVQERAWELCGEPEGRWFDLVRLEMVENLPKLRNSAEGGPPYGVYDKSVYFSPIPAIDTILNPNLGK